MSGQKTRNMVADPRRDRGKDPLSPSADAMRDKGSVPPAQLNYTYILECADGSLYTGWTNHLEERVAAHNAGKGGKYTRSHRPVRLVYYETFPTKEEAQRREYAVKQLTRQEKLLLVRQDKRGT